MNGKKQDDESTCPNKTNDHLVVLAFISQHQSCIAALTPIPLTSGFAVISVEQFHVDRDSKPVGFCRLMSTEA